MIHSLLDDYFNFLEEKLYGFCFGIFFSSWQKNAKEKKKKKRLKLNPIRN